LFGRSERLERRADDLNGGPVLTNRTPGGYEAGIAVKAGTAAALITDYERKAVAGRIPYLNLLDRSNHARLNCTMRLESPPHAIKAWSCEGCLTATLPHCGPFQIGRKFVARSLRLADFLDILNHRVDRGHDAAHHRRFVK
jgi:hypothetical protein